MLVLLDRDWGDGFDPQTKIFSHQCGGHLQPVGGVKPPTPDKSNAGNNDNNNNTNVQY